MTSLINRPQQRPVLTTKVLAGGALAQCRPLQKALEARLLQLQAARAEASACATSEADGAAVQQLEVGRAAASTGTTELHTAASGAKFHVLPIQVVF